MNDLPRRSRLQAAVAALGDQPTPVDQELVPRVDPTLGVHVEVLDALASTPRSAG